MNDINIGPINKSYRMTMFDGETNLHMLQQGWRALRYYGKRARQAVEHGDIQTKAQMIARADELLNVMSGVLDTTENAKLGKALMTIYSALRFTLFRANTSNSLDALRDYDVALSLLDQDLARPAESTEASP